MSEGLRVEVDRAACRGTAVCIRRAPATFSLDEHHRAVATDPPRDTPHALRDAESRCPNFAIKVLPGRRAR